MGRTVASAFGSITHCIYGEYGMKFLATLLSSFNNCCSLCPRTQQGNSELSLQVDAVFRDRHGLKNFE